MTNNELIENFYTSFAKGDAESMVECYHDDIVFKDPVFGQLKGQEAKNMWRMLVARSRGDLKITFNAVEADANSGSAKWVAEYTFVQTGRKVTNRITACMEFSEGKIIRHTDYFDMWKWSRQALGWKGYFFGWTPTLQKAIKKQTHKLLKAYIRNREKDSLQL